MTDNQPETVASADLTPVSPKPINLSSPVVVPSLQDHADALAMSPSLEPLSSADAAPSAQVPGVNGQHQISINSAETAAQNEANVNNNSALRNQVEAQSEENEYAKNFDSPVAEEADDQQDVSKTNESTSNTNASDSLNNTFDVGASDNISSSSTKPVQSVAETISASSSNANPSSKANAGTQLQIQAEPKNATNQTGQNEAVSAGEAAVSSDRPPVNADDAIDIQALVDNITARAAATEPSQVATTTAAGNSTDVNQPTPAASSLPPRPPTSQQPTPAYMRPEDIHNFKPGVSLSNVPPPSLPTMPLNAGAAYPYTAPGMAPEIPSNFQPPPPQYNVLQAPEVSSLYDATHVPIPSHSDQSFNTPQSFDTFLQEERKYVSEAKWDRFPDGSRIFVGNLSNERVSKREVFDIFSRFGRLAQISLKSAYGFVQYHTVAEGQTAMDNAQGMEVKGRKIHLEFSRPQKKDNDGDRNRGNKGRDRHHNDRDHHNGRRGRDDYRPRSQSPGRGGKHQRQTSYGRDRGHWQQNSSDRPRNHRSRSPPAAFGGEYRRRSPSPYRRGAPQSEADLDIPRRYGNQVPDVQLLLLQEVDRDFVSWVQQGFTERGLKIEVMFLNPRIPRELVIQRQIAEGVHAVSELDYRAQQLAKIPIQTFDRSAGSHNAQFYQYQDLDPKMAAELVVRAKSQVPYRVPAAYGNGPMPPPAYMPVAQPPQPYTAQAPASNSSLGALGDLDNVTLQRVLSAMQAPHGAASPNVGYGAPMPGAYGPSNPVPQGYPPAPAAPADPSLHVNNIMRQLTRYK